MAKEVDAVRKVQLNQVQSLARQLAQPGEKGKQAALSLAHMVRPGNSLVGAEALRVLVLAVRQAPSADARRWAAWALGGVVNYIDPLDLSNQVVPALINVIHNPNSEHVDLRVTGQAYKSLLHIGTPDAMAAVDAYERRISRRRGPVD
jgi:hypothetical protein